MFSTFGQDSVCTYCFPIPPYLVCCSKINDAVEKNTPIFSDSKTDALVNLFIELSIIYLFLQVHILTEYDTSMGKCSASRKNNYGIINGNNIWVNDGCRAKFLVCYEKGQQHLISFKWCLQESKAHLMIEIPIDRRCQLLICLNSFDALLSSRITCKGPRVLVGLSVSDS